MLLIDRGDLPSLVGLLIEPDPSRVVLWHVVEGDAGAPRRRAVVEGHRSLFEASDLVICSLEEEVEDDDSGLIDALMLVRAAMAARRWGCRRIVWPVQVGPDDAAVTGAVDLATAVSDLADLSRPPAVAGPDHGRGRGAVGGLVIDLPLVDLADEQVVDLADDGGAPRDAFWPCHGAADEPCGICPGCLRWLDAFRTLGRPLPVTAAAPVMPRTPIS